MGEEFQDFTRIQHNWVLKSRPKVAPNIGRKYFWECENCKATVEPPMKEVLKKMFKTPNKRRKIDGKHECGERMVFLVHDS